MNHVLMTPRVKVPPIIKPDIIQEINSARINSKVNSTRNNNKAAQRRIEFLNESEDSEGSVGEGIKVDLMTETIEDRFYQSLQHHIIKQERAKKQVQQRLLAYEFEIELRKGL